MSAVFAPKHILVATDFEDCSRHAMALGAELAQRFEARVTLLHVWTVPPPVYAGALAWPLAGALAGARAALDRAHAELDLLFGAGVRPRTTALLAAGIPADVILATAAAERADLVVLGTHGRRGLSRVFLGSTAARVVRESAAPVLTVGRAAGSG